MAAKRDRLKMAHSGQGRIRAQGADDGFLTHDNTFMCAVWSVTRNVNPFLSLRFVRCSRESKENLMAEGAHTVMLHLPGEKPASDGKEQGISAE